MKKLLLTIIGIISICGISNAGTISIASFVSNSDVTIARLETQRTTIQNWANGNVEGGTNIKAGSLVSTDFAQSVSIVTFRDEAFNDFTYTGMLPVTDSSLTSTISAGTSYVMGIRIQTSSQAHTYGASKDTYVYINPGGYYEFVEVANGASAPATPTNDLLLVKVVTSGSAITSVSDLRTTSIQITVNGSNFPSDYRDQALIVRDSTTAVHAEPGQIAIGTSLYTSTSDSTSLSTATAGNWIEGSTPNLKNQKFYVYAYNNSGTQFALKYATADPVNSDASSGTSGTLRYYTTGGTTYRALAWISGDTSSLIQTSAFGNFADVNTINRTTFQTGAVATGTTAIPGDDTIPQITEGDEYMRVTFRPTNSNHSLRIDVTANISNSGDGSASVALFQGTTANAIAAVQNFEDNNAQPYCVTFSHTMIAATTNPIVFSVRAGNNVANTTTFNGVSGGRRMGGVMVSSITVTESAM